MSWDEDAELAFALGKVAGALAEGGCMMKESLGLVGEKIFIFGGTSPYNGPPLFFTPNQLQQMPESEGVNLIDHNDLLVLDTSPSLKTLSMLHQEWHY